jgi:hypothetical protein
MDVPTIAPSSTDLLVPVPLPFAVAPVEMAGRLAMKLAMMETFDPVTDVPRIVPLSLVIPVPPTVASPLAVMVRLLALNCATMATA